MDRRVPLSDAGKDELALALVLWKDFKCDGKYDLDVALQMFKLANYLGVQKETEAMLAKLPPVKIVPRQGVLCHKCGVLIDVDNDNPDEPGGD